MVFARDLQGGASKPQRRCQLRQIGAERRLNADHSLGVSGDDSVEREER